MLIDLRQFTRYPPASAQYNTGAIGRSRHGRGAHGVSAYRVKPGTKYLLLSVVATADLPTFRFCRWHVEMRGRNP